MMATGKCPKCEKAVHQLRMEGVDAIQAFGTTGFNAITLQCPSCHTVLGAQLDPIAIRTDIINSLKRK